MNPAPIPWILCGPGCPPDITGDEMGSTATAFKSGFLGLRAVAGESSGYAHSSDIDEKSLKKASDTEKILKSLETNKGIYLVPAFTGLGTPYWNAKLFI